MKRLLNYIISIKHSEIFSLRLLPFLLGITLFLIWYSTYISNTNVSNVKVKYNSMNLRVDSLNYTFYVISKGTNKSPEYDKIEIQEFTSRMDSVKYLPVQFDSLHLHHYRKHHDYYEGNVAHQRFHYLFPEDYGICLSGYRYSSLSIFEIQGHQISNIDANSSQDSIKSDIQHYGLNFTRWVDRHIGNYSNLKDLDVAYVVTSYGKERAKCMPIKFQRDHKISAQGYMFHDFHPNFNYNIEFKIEGLGYDDSIMHHIPMKIKFDFYRRKRYLLEASPVPDRMTGHIIEYSSKEKIAEILNDGISINGTDLYVKEHYDKKSALITLAIGVLLSLLSSMVVSDIEKKKNTNNYSPRYWVYFSCDILKGTLLSLCCILAYIAFVNPYTWD